MECEIEFYKLRISELRNKIFRVIWKQTVTEKIFWYLVQHEFPLIVKIFTQMPPQNIPSCNLAILHCVAKMTDEKCAQISNQQCHWSYNETEHIMGNFEVDDLQKFARIYSFESSIVAEYASGDLHFTTALSYSRKIRYCDEVSYEMIRNKKLSNELIKTYYRDNKYNFEDYDWVTRELKLNRPGTFL